MANNEINPRNCGKKLEEILELSGVTLTELARILAVDKSTLSRLIDQQGAREASASVMNGLRALATAQTEGGELGARSNLDVSAVLAGLSALGTARLLGVPVLFGRFAPAVGMIAGAGLLAYGVAEVLRRRKEKYDDIDVRQTERGIEMQFKESHGKDRSGNKKSL